MTYRVRALSAPCRAICIAAALLLGGLVSAAAMGQVPGNWQSDLRRQLWTEHSCEVAFYSRIDVRTVEGHEVVFARAHCTDKRAFDANRQREDQAFKIQECGVQAC